MMDNAAVSAATLLAGSRRRTRPDNHDRRGAPIAAPAPAAATAVPAGAPERIAPARPPERVVVVAGRVLRALGPQVDFTGIHLGEDVVVLAHLVPLRPVD